MLIVVVVSFATLWLPYRAYVVYNSFARRRYENRWFLLCCRLAVYANSAINPLLYNAMSTKFRIAFTSLLCRRNGNQPIFVNFNQFVLGILHYIRSVEILFKYTGA